MGLRIISKYFKFKDKNFIYIGIIWIGIYHPWWSSTCSFLLALTTPYFLSLELYFLFALSLTPIFLTIWFIAFTDMVLQKYKIVLIVLIAVISGLFDIYLIYNVIFDVQAIGSFNENSIFDVQYNTISMIFLLFIVLVLLITGILFARESIKSGSPEIKLKGKFLTLAWILWAVGAILDSAVPLLIPLILLTRIILISSSILFYIGFLLPNFIKKQFGIS
ncbi:MAG: hypothetical protein EU541_07600 [Promethearchaeota archaeon]|nr:MAG: hypothetical protein EU541_07600 [Candidatus Lokiarchaeota archaeon]